MIVRECIFYVNLRQAYLSSPYYADRISSRTIMVTCVPEEYRDERRLRKLYGDDVKRVFVPKTSKALVKMVKERDQTAARLEKAEIALIRLANMARYKRLKKNPEDTAHEQSDARSVAESHDSSRNDLVPVPSPSAESDISQSRNLDLELPGSKIYLDLGEDNGEKQTKSDVHEENHEKVGHVKFDDKEDEYTHPYGLSEALADVRGSVAAQWIPVEKRPYHRPIGNFGRRVDTIRWTRNRLRELNLQIFKLRRSVRRGDGVVLPSAFIEFHNQEAAQAAHQVVSHHRPLQMSTRLLGVRPDEVIWSALRMSWWELIIRRFGILALVTAAVIFWSIPTALIGSISNVDGMIEKIHFLSFLKKLPKVILDFIQSFLPPIVLTLWMAAVPWMLRCEFLFYLFISSQDAFNSPPFSSVVLIRTV